jgi:hypothetical protein
LIPPTHVIGIDVLVFGDPFGMAKAAGLAAAVMGDKHHFARPTHD